MGCILIFSFQFHEYYFLNQVLYVNGVPSQAQCPKEDLYSKEDQVEVRVSKHPVQLRAVRM